MLYKHIIGQEIGSILTFDNEHQYNLFIDYLKQTKIDGSVHFLKDKCLINANERLLEVSLRNIWCSQFAVAKFMAVTRMLGVNYTDSIIPDYKPDTNSGYFSLGLNGSATINSEVLKRMQHYGQTSISKAITKTTIEQTLSQYETHLQKKLVKEGIINNVVDLKNLTIEQLKEKLLSVKQRKLLNRYEAINTVHNHLKNKLSLNEEDLLAVKNAVVTCQNNKPDWSERSFLQKLTDVLSLGLKPLYRHFFSKEKQLQKNLQNNNVNLSLS